MWGLDIDKHVSENEETHRHSKKLLTELTQIFFENFAVSNFVPYVSTYSTLFYLE